MKKILYVRPEDGGVSIITPMPKEHLERIHGVLTEEEYKSRVIERSVPKGVDYRFINDEDIPESREFRGAWIDVTAAKSIDICCEKARDISINRLRTKRNELLDKSDKEYMIKMERGQSLDDLKTKRQYLRNVTEKLKSLDCKGKINDSELINKIKMYGMELDNEK